VHFVDEHLDHGAIVLQKAVEVSDTDTPESLAAKILEHEHALYIEALKRIVSGAYKIVGRKVVFIND
jgi:phosphoribosylglycinamide formyltransferase-1